MTEPSQEAVDLYDSLHECNDYCEIVELKQHRAEALAQVDSALRAVEQRTRLETLSMKQGVEALAEALYVAGLRSSDKDGRPRLVAEGVYANLWRVQRIGLYRWQGGQLPATLEPREAPKAEEPKR